ncbi:protein IQ-DOMAIN 1-like isoform X1 [Chenopodium quinoa]|uniref:protein IQ-DOMAIN 1-like isoform X1 n=2 Tax=Chenopodium quinoa TaxID=63459 RepID=UPI000B76FBE2|nr:protein IQ-DOMAIN 1-like isoform X1 [Chenopodium quinoa]
MGCTKEFWLCNLRCLTTSTDAKMGRKGNWFSSMKKALNGPEVKEIVQESGKSKKKWFSKKKRSGLNTTPTDTAPATMALLPQPTVAPVVDPAAEPAKVSSAADKEQKLSGAADKEQTKHAYSVAIATAKAAEAAVAAAQAAAEVVRLTATTTPVSGKSKEEAAAIKIQTAFRGYMGRRTLRALRGLMRLKAVMQGQAIKRQTTNTLKSMQTLARVQSQVHERRQKMAEENLARQKQIQQKYAKEQAKELEKSQQNGDGWDSSRQTKEQIEAKLQSRHEAAIRRERTLAYAFTHQQAWKASSMSAHTLFMDVNNPHWGWSWLERWLAAKPWETATTPEKDFSNDNSPRIMASSKNTLSGNHELTKAYYGREKPSPTSIRKQSRSSTGGRLSTSKAPSKSTAATRNLRSQSPKMSPRKSIWGPEDDARSTLSMQSEQSRRNSVTGSSVRDDESLASSQTVPSYMAATESEKARTRFGGECKREKSVTPDRVSVSSARKRASQPASPARSRRSTSSDHT